MSIDQRVISVAEFERIAALPENSDHHLELINGEIITVPSNRYASWIAFQIGFFLQLYLRETGRTWYLTVGDGGYDLAGEVYAPDVALSEEEPGEKGFDAVIPLLAVEVISNPASSDEQSILRRKLMHYGRLGVIVWVVDFSARQIERIQPGQAVTVFKGDDVLSDEDIVPGFSLPLRDVFKPERDA